MDVGGTFLKSVVLAADGERLETGLSRLPLEGALGVVLEEAAGMVERVGAVSLGVGLAGLVRWPDGVFAWGPHLPGEAVPYREMLAARVGVPVVVDNDANLAALAEAATGSGAGFRVVLMLTLGTGIGAGLVVDGEIYRGRSYAGEAGHITIQPDGLRCACGRRGCWETLVSGSRIDDMAEQLAARDPAGRVAHRAGDERPSGRHLAEAAAGGDTAAAGFLADMGEWLGRGIVNLVMMIDPDVVVLGGAASMAGPALFDSAREAINSALPGVSHRDPVRLVPARHGLLAGAMGAAILAREYHGAYQ